MRILIVTPAFPYPPDTGGAIRVYNLLKWLSCDNEVDLLSIVHGDVGDEARAAIGSYCRALYLAPWGKSSRVAKVAGVVARAAAGIPFHTCYGETAALGQQLAATTAANRYDIIQFEHSYMAGNIRYLHPSQKAKTVLAMHNLACLQYYRLFKEERRPLARAKYLLSWVPMLSWEPKIAALYARTTVVSATDKLLLQTLDQKLKVSVVPNGVDTGEYAPGEPAGGDNILMVGTLSYKPNVDAVLYFYREIFPELQRSIPGCTLTIVGKDPDARIRLLATDPAVRVHANVADVRPYYRQAFVAVVPLSAGGGTRLKIIEALALGVPVVSTAIGCEGLEVVNGESILIADTPREFIASIGTLHGSAALRRALAASGRRLVEERYDWAAIARGLQALYGELLDSPPDDNDHRSHGHVNAGGWG